MNLLAHWARHHRRTAIGLLVLLETVKIAAGLHIGRYGLPALPPDLLQYLVLAVAAALLTVWRRHHRAAGAGSLPRRRVRRDLFLLFQGGYLLSVLAGNLGQSYFGDSGGYPLWRVQAVEMRRDTVVPAPTYYEKPTLAAPISGIEKRKGLGWRILGYTLLMLLGYAAAIFATIIACRLACSGQGALALLALLGIMGAYAVLGGLTVRALLAPKKFQALSRSGRRREIKGLIIGLVLGNLIVLLMGLASP